MEKIKSISNPGIEKQRPQKILEMLKLSKKHRLVVKNEIAILIFGLLKDIKTARVTATFGIDFSIELTFAKKVGCIYLLTSIWLIRDMFYWCSGPKSKKISRTPGCIF